MILILCEATSITAEPTSEPVFHIMSHQLTLFVFFEPEMLLIISKALSN